MIINATSHTIRNIWILFLFIILFFVASIITLKNGISIDNITLPTIKIDQLYMKLDKKLIVEIQSIEISKETQTDTSLEESTELIKNFPYLNQFFSRIVIQNLIYNNEKIVLHYEEDLFKLESQHLNINVHVRALSDTSLEIDIEEAHLKDYALNLNGKATLDVKSKCYHYEGNYEFKGLQGIAIFDVANSILSYHLQSEHFTNKTLSDVVNFIVSQVELDPIAKGWIHENIVGKDYQLHFFEGRVNLKTGEYYPLEMKGKATVMDANISFEHSVPAAHAKEIGITFEKDKLLFDVKEPTYEKRPVKADVFIYNLIGKGTGIVVDLNATSKLDAPIHKILHAFKIDVPLTQLSGKTDAHVKLDIRFLPFDINATGHFKVYPGDFILAGAPLSTKYGDVILDNYNVTLDKANLRYKNIFDINATGLYDTRKDRFEGKVDINSVLLDFNGTKLLQINNVSDLNGTFYGENNATIMQLPYYDATIVFEPQNNRFDFPNLSKVADVSPFMRDNNLTKGSVNVITKDFENFRAKLLLEDVATPLLDNNVSLKNFTVDLTTDTKTLDARTIDNKISLHYDKEIAVTLKDVNLSIPKNSSSMDIPIKTTILGENVSLLDDANKTILSDRFTMTLFKDTIRLNSRKNKSTFEYEKKKNLVTINATNLDALSINALLNKKYFNEGDFSLTMSGENDDNMQGTFIIHKSYVKELQFFNNLMATINAIPSLIVFNDPNFNQKGYFIDNGYIEFSQTPFKMGIEEMQLRGVSADILGTGAINLENDTLSLNLHIKTLKTFSSAIDMIPLIGGIILGEDKRISTNVDVTGPTSDPKIETHLIMDTLKSPINILKRTLELPLEILK